MWKRRPSRAWILPPICGVAIVLASPLMTRLEGVASVLLFAIIIVEFIITEDHGSIEPRYKRLMGPLLFIVVMVVLSVGPIIML
jgi:hypothetical protein